MAFARTRRHAELDCLRSRRLDCGRPVAVRFRVLRAGRPTRSTRSSILAHESYHTAGVANEAAANCFAIQAMAWTAAQLGARSQTRQSCWHARWRRSNRRKATGYATTECHAGHRPRPPPRDIPIPDGGAARTAPRTPQRRRVRETSGRDPRQRHHPHPRPVAPDGRRTGDRRPAVAGGVGTHEWALPTPERVDLAGRCVLPAFTDAHVHFPTLGAGTPRRSPRGRRLGRRPRWRPSAHIHAAGDLDPRHGLARCGLARAADGRRRSTRSPGATPAALWSQDHHSLWLNSAALARAGGDLDVPRRRRRARGAGGSPTGVLREESAWRFRERFVTVTEDEWVAATREGIRVANARGVAAVHDKDGWLGAASIFGRIHEQRRPVDAGLAVTARRPDSRVDGAAAAAPHRRRLSSARLREDVHGRDARLQDGVDARRLRGGDHEP